MAILTPYGFIKGHYPSQMQSIGPNGQYLCPHDHQHNTTGEDGYYADSHLGGASGPQLISQGPVPSDFQTASTYGYTPAVRGWVATPTGYVQGSYYPQPAGGGVYPVAAGLSDAAEAAQAAAYSATGGSPPLTPAQVRDEQRKNVTYWMSVVTGVVIAGSAALAIYRSAKGLAHDQMIRNALEKKLL